MKVAYENETNFISKLDRDSSHITPRFNFHRWERKHPAPSFPPVSPEYLAG